MTERVYAHPTLGLIASPEMVAAQKEKIGKWKLNTDRNATLEDHMDAETTIIGQRVDKESLSDDDIREITVAQIDERMLDLTDADENSPATTKARNDLRDLKAAIIELTRGSERSFYGAALDQAEELETSGKYDEAEVMRAAAELLLQTSTHTDGEVDYTSEDYRQQKRAAVKSQIATHNTRVTQNESRRN